MKKMIMPKWLEPYAKKAEYFQHFLSMVDGVATEYEINRMNILLNTSAEAVRLDASYRPNDLAREYIERLISAVWRMVEIYSASKPLPLQDESNQDYLALVTKDLAVCIEKTYPRVRANTKLERVKAFMSCNAGALKMDYKTLSSNYYQQTKETVSQKTWTTARREVQLK